MEGLFTEAEREFMRSALLARVATVAPNGQPDVAPVGAHFTGDAFEIVGIDLERTLKYRNVSRGNPKTALVVDDLRSTDPWRPRGVKMHGEMEIVEGPRGKVLRFIPKKKWSWGIEGASFGADGKPARRFAKVGGD